MMLVPKDSGITSDPDIQVTVLGCLAEKLDVAAMKKIIAATHENFL